MEKIGEIMCMIFLGVDVEDYKINVLSTFFDFEPKIACQKIPHVFACMMDGDAFNKSRYNKCTDCDVSNNNEY
jgi:hypothetical protein